MYLIESAPYGLKITFRGDLTLAELERWIEESAEVLADMPSHFGVLVDMRELNPLDDARRKVFIRGQHAYRRAGMARSAVITANPGTRVQFESIARQSGIHAGERYFDAVSNPNWEITAAEWVAGGS